MDNRKYDTEIRPYVRITKYIPKAKVGTKK